MESEAVVVTCKGHALVRNSRSWGSIMPQASPLFC